MAEHEAVAAAVIDGDPQRARQAMEDLIVLTQSHIEYVLADPDDGRPHLAEQNGQTENWNRQRR
jgi:DNA-binding GntR family transcriptional regulator